jgi:mannobiose 2-epimerase
MHYFYPSDAGKSSFHREPDWKEVTDPRSAGLSYGHNVEFAWLMVRAQQVLGQTPAWPHFYAHLQHAMRFGHDGERGGLYNRGVDDQPANDTSKVWWVQAEWIAALTDAVQHQQNREFLLALDKVIHFVNDHMADKKDGIWLDTVTADGKPKSSGKAHGWKANYHDVRALVKFIKAFEARSVRRPSITAPPPRREED